MNQFDRDLFHWINRWPEWMNPTMQFFSRGLDSVAMKIVLVVTFIALVSSPK
ncbi:MAG: hypothetical protein JNM04_00110, partial [Chthonomonas sp.]|nr:hypothetical protein [Chthonomonas sp.]